MKIAIILNNNPHCEIAEKDVICADGGYRYAKGKNILALVGDFDSLPRIPKGINIVRYPKEKNMTDGEIAVRYAIEKGFDDLVIYGATGGRLDHVLGNISLLSLSHSLGVRAKILSRDFSIYYTQTNLIFESKKNQLVSVFAYGGDALVKCQKGMRYPMDKLTLKSFCTRGISNITEEEKIEIVLEKGEVIVFHFYDNPKRRQKA